MRISACRSRIQLDFCILVRLGWMYEGLMLWRHIDFCAPLSQKDERGEDECDAED
jgi:hypothetical protein